MLIVGALSRTKLDHNQLGQLGKLFAGHGIPDTTLDHLNHLLRGTENDRVTPARRTLVVALNDQLVVIGAALKTGDTVQKLGEMPLGVMRELEMSCPAATW